MVCGHCVTLALRQAEEGTFYQDGDFSHRFAVTKNLLAQRYCWNPGIIPNREYFIYLCTIYKNIIF